MTEQIIPSEEDPLYSAETVASIFDVDVHTVRHWIKEGKIHGRKILGRWRVQRSEVIRVANEEYGE